MSDEDNDVLRWWPPQIDDECIPIVARLLDQLEVDDDEPVIAAIKDAWKHGWDAALTTVVTAAQAQGVTIDLNFGTRDDDRAT